MKLSEIDNVLSIFNIIDNVCTQKLSIVNSISIKPLSEYTGVIVSQLGVSGELSGSFTQTINESLVILNNKFGVLISNINGCIVSVQEFIEPVRAKILSAYKSVNDVISEGMRAVDETVSKVQSTIHKYSSLIITAIRNIQEMIAKIDNIINTMISELNSCINIIINNMIADISYSLDSNPVSSKILKPIVTGILKTAMNPLTKTVSSIGLSSVINDKINRVISFMSNSLGTVNGNLLRCCY